MAMLMPYFILAIGGMVSLLVGVWKNPNALKAAFGVTLITLFFAVRLVEIPSVRRHVEAGVCTGLIAFIAINHGFYVFLAFASLIIYLHTKDRMRSGAKNFFSFLAGTGLGLVPWLYFFAVVPGFFKNYWERLGTILSVFGAGKLRVSEPIPWPWLVSWKEVCCSLPTFLGRILEFTNRCSIGVIFIFVIVYYLISVPVVMRFKKVQERPQALFVASVFIGVFYLGHMFSRSNFLYLGEGIFPVVAGVLSAAVFSRPPFKKIICIAATLFMTVSFFSAGLLSNIIFKTMVPKEGMTWYPVGKDRIWLTLPDVEYCDNVKKLVAHYVKPEEPVLLAPLLTTFYCLLDKESPVYELYFHISPSPVMEEREIRQLEEKKVRWAIAANLLIDARPEQAMSNSHPLLWRYLMEHFEFVTSKGLRPGYFLMRRKP